MHKLALIAVLVACGGSSKPAAAPAAGAAKVNLVLGELKIVDVGKDKAIAVRADGTIEADGTPVGIKVTADGRVIRTDTTEVGFQLLPDGTIKGPRGEVLEVTLGADGTISNGDKKISLDDQGLIVGGNPDAPQVRIEGATSPELKRTAMFVLITLTSPIQTPAPPATQSAPPPATQP
jgi:hypothetical protein